MKFERSAKIFLLAIVLVILGFTANYLIEFIAEIENTYPVYTCPVIPHRPKPIPTSSPSFPEKKLKTLENLKKDLISVKKDFIEANLREMKVRFYKNGEAIKEYPILVKGKEDEWGETVAGLFHIKRMQRVAFSNLGDVYMPWWMEFWGNYSIHGWPYYPSGIFTPLSFSSGCINLTTENAKELYQLSSLDLPVLVLEKDFENDNFDYSFLKKIPDIPEISSHAYLTADLKNNFVFLEKNSDEVLSIASVTKLMTATVASENFLLSFKREKISTITVNKEMIKPEGYTPGIDVGKKYTYFELLYPTLMFSSNDAAEALAVWYGREKFVDLMNKRAESLGMNNSHFVDSYGYHAGNVSTAEDLFYLSRCLLNERHWLLDISKGKIFNDFGEIRLGNLKNFNLFQDDPDFIGGKVGATPVAKKTGIFLFNLDSGKEKRPIAIIVLGSNDNEKDAKALLSWLKSLFRENIPS